MPLALTNILCLHLGLFDMTSQWPAGTSTWHLSGKKQFQRGVPELLGEKRWARSSTALQTAWSTWTGQEPASQVMLTFVTCFGIWGRGISGSVKPSQMTSVQNQVLPDQWQQTSHRGAQIPKTEIQLVGTVASVPLQGPLPVFISDKTSDKAGFQWSLAAAEDTSPLAEYTTLNSTYSTWFNAEPWAALSDISKKTSADLGWEIWDSETNISTLRARTPVNASKHPFLRSLVSRRV